jgi:hypothetical protein
MTAKRSRCTSLSARRLYRFESVMATELVAEAVEDGVHRPPRRRRFDGCLGRSRGGRCLPCSRPASPRPLHGHAIGRAVARAPKALLEARGGMCSRRQTGCEGGTCNRTRRRGCTSQTSSRAANQPWELIRGISVFFCQLFREQGDGERAPGEVRFIHERLEQVRRTRQPIGSFLQRAESVQQLGAPRLRIEVVR